MPDNEEGEKKVRGFQKGHPGGPGRPKGSRNKLSEDFLKALYDDFREHGPGVVAKVREDRPVAYLKVVASVIPKQVEITNVTDDLSDEMLEALITHVRASLEQPEPPAITAPSTVTVN